MEVTENVGYKLQNAYSTVYMISVYRVFLANRNSEQCYSYDSGRLDSIYKNIIDIKPKATPVEKFIIGIIHNTLKIW